MAPPGMVTTFTQQGATMRHEMCQQIAPLHSAASQCNWQFFKSGSSRIKCICPIEVNGFDQGFAQGLQETFS